MAHNAESNGLQRLAANDLRNQKYGLSVPKIMM